MPDNEISKACFPRARAWIELDRAALRNNVSLLQSLLPQGCELMPAVKANAYGHGDILISQELQKMGIKAFCVATVDEGVSLRQAGIGGIILILGYTHPEQFSLLLAHRLTQTVIDYQYALMLEEYGRTLEGDASREGGAGIFPVHIGIDTGMHRLGVDCGQPDELRRIFGMKHLKVNGLYTHLCVSDAHNPYDEAFTLAQIQAFYKAAEQARQFGADHLKLHLLSSYGLINYPSYGADYVRAGIALYGMLSTRHDTACCSLPLKPVLSLKARVSSVRSLPCGESAGYGLKFTAGRDCRIAALSIGYADGLPRALSCGASHVLINGRKAPIAGRVCMDQTLVDVTDIPDVAAGSVAVLIGRSGKEEITACDLAEGAGTISNEILSRLGARLQRFYVD